MLPKLYGMESETIETFFNTRCKVGAIVKDEATTSKKFYIEADFGFFDTPRKPKPFVANKQDCYSSLEFKFFFLGEGSRFQIQDFNPKMLLLVFFSKSCKTGFLNKFFKGRLIIHDRR